MRILRHFLPILFVVSCAINLNAQIVVDSIFSEQMVILEPLESDSVGLHNEDTLDTVSILRLQDSLIQLHEELAKMEKRLYALSRMKDSLVVTNGRFQRELEARNKMLEEKIQALQEKELMVREKEQLYRDAMSSSSVDSAKFLSEIMVKEANIELKEKEIALLQKNIDARDSTLMSQKIDYQRISRERDRYIRLVDSLRALVVAADMENVKKQEENKYLAQKALDAEERAKASEATVAAATNRKKKVRPVQGIAMRMFRTPDWELRLNLLNDGTYERIIRNKNAGNIEFDYVSGASVMLWDMSKYFNRQGLQNDSLESRFPRPDIRRFDQQFAYDLGVYVGFGGTNLFKNFYVGPSFRFVDFFYLTMGVNICEYEMLDEEFQPGQALEANISLDQAIAKTWLVKPFVSLSIDLDFLSYIKK